ncbi:MAG: hypothetical protein ABIO39_15100 [Caulobacteraceae bacterium]
MSLAGAALAQAPATPTPDQNYVSQKIGDAYGKAIAALPDWNGSWSTIGGLMFDPSHQVLTPGTDEAFSTGPLEGSYLTGIPYKPEFQKQYQERIAESLKGIVRDPVGDCRQPHGMPRQVGASPGGPEIIVLPSQVRMTWYWFNATRRIFTDGRPHPTGDDLVPSFMGHSIGKWEGDTLVVDTVGMHAGIYDRSEAPHSDQVHLVERIKLVGPDLLQVAMTIEDPVMLTAPWNVTRLFRRTNRIPQAEAAYCEGGRIEMSGGTQKLVLPGERDIPATKPRRVKKGAKR